MEIERRRSARSFLSLFDCNGLSRKKLFPATLNLPEDNVKKSKNNVENIPKPQLYRTKVSENGINPSYITSCDSNCELSVSSNVGCGTKAPCLIARLMGLDSLPTSTVNKLSSNALRASNSDGSSHCHEGAFDSMDSRAHEATTILDFKQKSEAACYALPHRKIVDTHTVKGSRGLEKISPPHYGGKGESTLLAIQANADVQRRDTLTSNSNRGYRQKEQTGIASNQFFRTQKQILQQRTCTSPNSHYNELVQNRATKKGRSPSTVDSKKPTTRSSTGGARKTANKDSVVDNVRPNSSSRRASGAKKEIPPIKTRRNSTKKRKTRRDVLPINAVINYESKTIKCNTTTDESMNQNALNKKASKGIISFTFTSPLKKDSKSSTHTNNVDVNAPGSSVLFDREVQDFTSRINSPEFTLATGVTSAVLPSSEVSVESGEVDRSFHSDLRSGKLHSVHNFGCSSSDDNQQLQGTKAMLQHSHNSNIETECYQDVAAEQVCGLSDWEDYMRSRNLELECVKDMLSNGELTSEGGESETIRNKVIKRNVLENWSSEVERNLLFDFMSECLQFGRSRQSFIGRSKAGTLHSKVWWEEDLYREIQRFKSMQEVRVEGLVHMNMSSPHATWLHFQTDQPLEEILLVVIERHISNCLIDDLVFDLLHH